MKYNIEITITDIAVYSNYYFFNYSITLNGKLLKERHYSDTHSRGHEIDKFKKELNDGYALQLAIEHMF